MDSVKACNIALAHLGDRRITRLDDEAQREDALVRYCAEFYDIALGEALEAHRWTFAKVDEPLVRTTPPVAQYAYAHQLPTNMVRFLQLYPGSADQDKGLVYFVGRVNRFRLMGDTVQSNEMYIALQHIFYNDNPVMWSRGFVACFTRLLASYLSGPLADSVQAAEAHRAHYERVDLPNAMYLDAVQDQSGENNDNEVRLAGSGLVQAGRSEGFYTDYYDDESPPGGLAAGGTTVGGGCTIG